RIGHVDAHAGRGPGHELCDALRTGWATRARVKPAFLLDLTDEDVRIDARVERGRTRVVLQRPARYRRRPTATARTDGWRGGGRAFGRLERIGKRLHVSTGAIRRIQ